MQRYRVLYHRKDQPADEVEADHFKDVVAGGVPWVEFVRYVDDGHVDLLERRVFRVNAHQVATISLVESHESPPPSVE